MKSISKQFMVAGLVLGAVLCASLVSYADGGVKGCTNGGPKDGRDGKKWDRIGMMKKMLDLNEAQVSNIKAIFADSKKNNEALMEKTKTDLKSLKEKVKAKASDADLTSALTILQDDHQKMMDARKSEMDQMKAILTPMQQAKAAIEMSERMGDWKDKGPHHKKGDKDKDNK